MRGRRPLVHRAVVEVREGPDGIRPADRPEPGRAVPDRARARQRRGGRPDAHPGGRALRSRRAVRRRGQHGETARRRRVVGGRQRRGSDLWRLRLRGGLRHRAQVPRNKALPGGADLDEHDSRLHGRARARPAQALPMSSPLSGVTVVSIEQAVSAPFATRQLADLGARVIKIERPDGGDFARHYDLAVGGLSSYFVWLNRSEESLTLNLKEPAAQGVLAKLLEKADVVVPNLAAA